MTYLLAQFNGLKLNLICKKREDNLPFFMSDNQYSNIKVAFPLNV